mmetsp:Transcript_7691/g.17226  ORF Transcript_7691/g.17226 Transcript_7691/m.17226 type:complete len:201 (+) Transcript_7691:1359-1961(+)
MHQAFSLHLRNRRVHGMLTQVLLLILPADLEEQKTLLTIGHRIAHLVQDVKEALLPDTTQFHQDLTAQAPDAAGVAVAILDLPPIVVVVVDLHTLKIACVLLLIRCIEGNFLEEGIQLTFRHERLHLVARGVILVAPSLGFAAPSLLQPARPLVDRKVGQRLGLLVVLRKPLRFLGLGGACIVHVDLTTDLQLLHQLDHQ